MAQILEEVTKDVLVDFQKKAKHNQLLIIKFGAEWCVPCQNSKKQVYGWFNKMPKNITCADIDIDEHIDLYVALKSKKMLKGVPILLAYSGGGEKDYWFIPDVSSRGENTEDIDRFFKECIKKTQ